MVCSAFSVLDVLEFNLIKTVTLMYSLCVEPLKLNPLNAELILQLQHTNNNYHNNSCESK